MKYVAYIEESHYGVLLMAIMIFAEPAVARSTCPALGLSKKRHLYSYNFRDLLELFYGDMGNLNRFIRSSD